jgi:hypothetical protein
MTEQGEEMGNMQHIMVEIQDREKAQQLYNVLQALDFVTHITTDEQDIQQIIHEDAEDKTDEFFSYAGLWSGRDISAATLRQQAWPRQA